MKREKIKKILIYIFYEKYQVKCKMFDNFVRIFDDQAFFNLKSEHFQMKSSELLLRHRMSSTNNLLLSVYFSCYHSSLQV